MIVMILLEFYDFQYFNNYIVELYDFYKFLDSNLKHLDFHDFHYYLVEFYFFYSVHDYLTNSMIFIIIIFHNGII